jgi:hypothetical protein
LAFPNNLLLSSRLTFNPPVKSIVVCAFILVTNHIFDMQKALEHLPIFNGRKILTTLQNGEWWVAVKPICEALDVNYNRQYQNINEDEILSQLFAEQQTVAADGKIRKMICLPERYVYGWLFSIRSESPTLLEYKRTCYDLLYNHFHGMLSGRAGFIQQKSEIDVKIEKLEEKLLETEEYKEIQDLKAQKAQLSRKLNAQVKEYDVALISTQGTLFPANAADN